MDYKPANLRKFKIKGKGDKGLMMKLKLTIFLFLFISDILYGFNSDSDSELSRKASQIESNAASVERAARDVADAASRVKNETSKVEGMISTAKSALLTIDSQISSVERKTSEQEQGARNLRAEESQYLLEFNKYEKQKSILKTEVSTLINEVFKLNNRLNIRKSEFEALQELKNDFKEAQNHFNKIIAFQDTISLQQKKTNNEHLNWINSFKILIDQYAPNPENIQNREDFIRAYGDVNYFIGNIPSMGPVKKEEEKLISYIEDTMSRIRIQQDGLKDYVNGKSYSIYLRNSDNKSTQKKLQKINTLLDEYYSELFRQRSAVYFKAPKRSYLSRSIPLFWQNAIKLRLQAINIEDASEIISEASNALNDNRIYSMIRVALEKRNKRTSETLRINFSPRIARRDLLESKKYTENLIENLNDFPISNQMKRELSALLLDTLRNINQIKTNQIEKAIDEEDEYFKERKRRMNGMLRRLGSDISLFCLDLANNVNSAETSKIRNETSFLEFIEKCW